MASSRAGKPTSVRLSDELTERLDRLAAAVDRPRSWLIEQAVSRYLDEEAWQVAAIAEALAEYRSGQASLMSHEDFMAELTEKIQAAPANADRVA